MVFSNLKKNILNPEDIYDTFRDNGIVTINNLIDEGSIKDIKKKLLSIELDRTNRVNAMNLHKNGIVKLIFNEKIRYLINLFIPDGIIWHLHYLKSHSNQFKPHFTPETRYGYFHRDRITNYIHDKVEFFDIMIYLNDVGENDGAFAFLPIRPDNDIDVDKAKKSSKIIGPSGLGILSRVDWWHSATANVGNNDREMIRVSMAKNMYYDSIHNSHDYIDLRNYYKDKDKFLYYLFGGDRRWGKNIEQPKQKKIDNIIFNIPPLNYQFSKSYKSILKKKIKSIIN